VNHLETIRSLEEQYNSNPLLKGLVQISSAFTFGITGGIEAAILTHCNNITKKRLKIFFDELEKGNIQLTQELIESEDFLHRYFATGKAAINSRRAEKIQFFSRLFLTGTIQEEISDTDEYEELLRILDKLSYREIQILFILDKYEIQYSQKENENDLQRANHFWSDFEEDLQSSLQITKEEINGLLVRLLRTGCYEIFTGTYYGYTGGKGKLTSIYHRLKKCIWEKTK